MHYRCAECKSGHVSYIGPERGRQCTACGSRDIITLTERKLEETHDE